MARILFVLLIVVSQSLVGIRSASAELSYHSQDYDYRITWSGQWTKNDQRSSTGSVDILVLDWDEQISVQFAGFTTISLEPPDIAMDYLARFVASDSTSRLVQQASVDSSGVLSPTVVSFVNDRGSREILAIYPFALPDSNGAMAIVWQFLETTSQNDIDESAKNFSYQLPSSNEGHGPVSGRNSAREASTLAPTPETGACPEYPNWRVAVMEIVSDLDTILDGLGITVANPYAAAGATSSARYAIIGLEQRLLNLDTPGYAITAETALSSALSDYDLALEALYNLVTGSEVVAESTIKYGIIAAEKYLDSFDYEIDQIDIGCEF